MRNFRGDTEFDGTNADTVAPFLLSDRFVAEFEYSLLDQYDPARAPDGALFMAQSLVSRFEPPVVDAMERLLATIDARMSPDDPFVVLCTDRGAGWRHGFRWAHALVVQFSDLLLDRLHFERRARRPWTRMGRYHRSMYPDTRQFLYPDASDWQHAVTKGRSRFVPAYSGPNAPWVARAELALTIAETFETSLIAGGHLEKLLLPRLDTWAVHAAAAIATEHEPAVLEQLDLLLGEVESFPRDHEVVMQSHQLGSRWWKWFEDLHAHVVAFCAQLRVALEDARRQRGSLG